MTDYNPPPSDGFPEEEPNWPLGFDEPSASLPPAAPPPGTPPPSAVPGAVPPSTPPPAPQYGQTPPPSTPPPTTPYGQTPPPSAVPPSAMPPGAWAPQPGMPQVPAPGQTNWQGAGSPPPPPANGYPAFPPTPPPGAASSDKGRVLKVIGISVAVLVGIGVMVAAFLDPSTNAAYIDSGECFAEFSQFETLVAGDEEYLVERVDSADCNEPHALEAYYVGDAYENIDGVYSDSMISEVAVETCETQFEAFVNFEWETSEFDYWWLTPSPQGWDAGDRELICLIGDYERDLTVGTLENAGR